MRANKNVNSSYRIKKTEWLQFTLAVVFHFLSARADIYYMSDIPSYNHGIDFKIQTECKAL